MKSRRPIIMVQVRGHRYIARPRRYLNVQNAIAALSRNFLFSAQPGTIFELSHEDIGKQICIVRVNVAGWRIEKTI